MAEPTTAQPGWEAELFRLLVESTQDYAVFVVDLGGRVLTWNPGAERLLGYAEEEVRGEPASILFTLEDREEGVPEQELRTALARGRAGNDRWLVKKDGTRLWCSGVLTLLKDPAGRPRALAKVLRDLTDARRAEEELRQAREFLGRLLEHAPAPVFVLSADCRYRLVNRAWEEMVGRRREEVVGKRIEEVFPPGVAEKLVESTVRVVETGAPLAYEPVVDGPGGPRHFQAVKFPLRDPAGRVEGVGGIALDVTARRRAEQELRVYSARLRALSRRVVEVQEQERRHLARELHDEVGQVLTAVSLHLQAALAGPGPGDGRGLRECAEVVQQAVARVRDLSVGLRPPALDVLGLEAALRAHLAAEAARAGLAAEFAGSLSGRRFPATLEAACFRVAQEALTNVVRHAQARRVWVELAESGGGLGLAVRDDGRGFDVAATRELAARGEGLGLLSMRERAELLGGRVDIDSSPGRGTTVRAHFPAGRAACADGDGRPG